MYENITYAEIKMLPRYQKAEAWKELKGMYSTQKELADKLGVSPNLVYAMISRYAKNEPVVSVQEENADETDQREKTRGRRKKKETQENINAMTDIYETIHEVEPDGLEENTSFSIKIKKVVTGEDAQFFLSGIGSTLLKDQKYQIEVIITESKAV